MHSYASIAPFGRDTIRRFSDHIADLSRMTAHEYANMLEVWHCVSRGVGINVSQCATPCFEHLFPDPWDGEVQSLLFTLARWHKLAKLRLHTDSTLRQLEIVTRDFGDAMRKFRDGCCEEFETFETPAEQDKRVRAAQAAAARSQVQNPVDGTRQRRRLNLNTYKFHSMPDYAPTIRFIGTTDNYTTSIVRVSFLLIYLRYNYLRMS